MIYFKSWMVTFDVKVLKAATAAVMEYVFPLVDEINLYLYCVYFMQAIVQIYMYICQIYMYI